MGAPAPPALGTASVQPGPLTAVMPPRHAAAPAQPARVPHTRKTFARLVALALVAAAVGALGRLLVPIGRGDASFLVSLVAQTMGLLFAVGLLGSSVMIVRHGPGGRLRRATFMALAAWLWLCVGIEISTGDSGQDLAQMLLIGPIGAWVFVGPAFLASAALAHGRWRDGESPADGHAMTADPGDEFEFVR